jgi:hypothetical protein
MIRNVLAVCIQALAFFGGKSAEADFAKDILPVLEEHCFDCHGNEENPKGGVNLERFRTEAEVLLNRGIWGGVFEKIESGQMPPPKRHAQLTAGERAQLLAWISDIAAQPDPSLGARDPGKPVLRRLTRLEYNNTVRDLLGLSTDVFMFPERQPLQSKDYFRPASGKMGDEVNIRLNEFGGRVSVLLPADGLPGDNRAEHGFSNRGDAMNLSPLLFEQYVTLAGRIANVPDLPQRSRAFAELLDVSFAPRIQMPDAKSHAPGSLESRAVSLFAPAVADLRRGTGSTDTLEHLREEFAAAFREGRGGVYDVEVSTGHSVVPGKGATIRVKFGDAGGKTLSLNPDEDVWLAPFGTAEETSGQRLLANKAKGAKRFELTFKVENGDPGEGVERLAVFVIGRERESGEVALTARFSDDTEAKITAEIGEGSAGSTFFSFAAVPGETIKSLVVNGANFSGDFVLLDDFGFVTSGQPRPSAAPPVLTVETPAVKKAPQALAQPQPRPAAERLAMFLERAFRRPATAGERARFNGFFEAARQSGKPETEAMRATVQAVLASPGFLFLAETARADASPVRALDDFELASRLSYFLWASAPDDELLDTARRGALRGPAMLEAQARRMLRDPRARELGESFAVQWLRLDQLYTAKPDPGLFKAFYAGPQGKNTLHGPMLIEALLLFETVLVEDRSLLEFVDADYTWLNPRLATLYGIELNEAAPSAAETLGTNRELKPAAKDPNHLWRRIPLTDQTRGGFFTMAGPLTVTSLPFRTSPVKRGAWLLETIFNRPPQEPKIAFAFEDDTKDAAAQLSVRARFEAHRDKPACYSCHMRLDPPGFALERFDAIGQWRELDAGQPVDARAEWNGQLFDGPAGFKAALLKNPNEFTRGFVEQLLSYALGRRLEIFDQPTVTEIQRAAAADGYRLSRVVVEIVKSFPFTHTRNVPISSH